jgi:hypothetical protein
MIQLIDYIIRMSTRILQTCGLRNDTCPVSVLNSILSYKRGSIISKAVKDTIFTDGLNTNSTVDLASSVFIDDASQLFDYYDYTGESNLFNVSNCTIIPLLQLNVYH